MTDDLDGRLWLEEGCVRLRTWRLEVPRTVSPAALATALGKLGWGDESRFAALRELRHPDGHHVLLVSGTGRVQIRLDLGVPEPLRATTAGDVARDVLDAVQRVLQAA